jgi:hypothetical protein
MRNGKGWTCPHCEKERPHYALGSCNSCYRKRKGYDKAPGWLNNCQRCGRAWSKVQHKAYGLCGMCHLHATTTEGRVDYYAAQYEINRPDSSDRLLTPENLTALKLARMVGATEAARMLDVNAECFRMWAANREAVPVRHRKNIRDMYRQAWREARGRS